MAWLELAVLVGGIALLAATYRIRKRGTPFYPTPARAIHGALQRAGLKPGDRFYDLGAGTGRVLIAAEREFGARAVGYELSPLFYVIAKMNLWLHRSQAELRFGNFFNADLRDADIVFCFLVGRVMQRVEEKVQVDLKPNARVLVYAFPFPGLEPRETIPVRKEWNMFLYTK
ncbi:class I SAM-dependent methyltransferase [Patescibacteria group bacterium]|nr:class I SAM-dependent methyltransferase [Patescibacteria group bacterium]